MFQFLGEAVFPLDARERPGYQKVPPQIIHTNQNRIVIKWYLQLQGAIQNTSYSAKNR